ncbi:Arc family DNA-binding protein [uncultured Thiothrix sp.]|jgi:hypothetical protein|uniref:Arc family DNA-binding protein n=1 Tax=uncultured Thiothrix sp. TaxID=223185 RepID=UPI002610E95C|nr:Arc family DNA-binding protein [uncultured Thiothrix sp.]HMT93901.1 Arc family DNA-binding protein [Thiolinea sp.]
MTANTKKKPPFGLRMPESVQEWLKQRALGNNRSMNAEVVTILQDLMMGRLEQQAFERGRLEGISQAMNP